MDKGFGSGPKDRNAGNLPSLNQAQLWNVAMSLGTVLNFTFMAYGHGIGANRIEELEDFGRKLLADIKNMEIVGIDMALEPAVVEAIHTIVAANIPKIKRID